MSVTVELVMPSLPDRGDMPVRAIHSLRGQIHPPDWKLSLSLDGDPRPTLGAKLNRIINVSTSEFVVLVDDDDVHRPHRVRAQVQPLLDNPLLLITGTSQIVYHEESTGRVYRFAGDGRWIGGLAFRRTAWEQVNFEDISKGVDTKWLRQFAKSEKLDLKDDSLFLATLHDGNTCKKNISGPHWSELSSLPEHLK